MLADKKLEKTASHQPHSPLHESPCVASAMKRKLYTGAQRTSGQVSSAVLVACHNRRSEVPVVLREIEN